MLKPVVGQLEIELTAADTESAERAQRECVSFSTLCATSASSASLR